MRTQLNHPQIASLAIEMLRLKPCSIAEIASEARHQRLCAGYGDDTYHATAMDVVGWIGGSAIALTHAQAKALELMKRDGCLDSWPEGEEKGYDVFDSILWRPPTGPEIAASKYWRARGVSCL